MSSLKEKRLSRSHIPKVKSAFEKEKEKHKNEALKVIFRKFE